jgi:adenine-specific DNA-methyltransferase
MKTRFRLAARYAVENDATLAAADCLKLLKQIPDGAVQLVVTSPPYNLNKEYERNQALDDYMSLQKSVIAECVRVTAEGGSICWQVGNHVNGHKQIIPLDILLHPIFSAYEQSDQIRLRNRIVWHFEHGLHCKRRFSGRYETIMWYTKGDGYSFDLDAVRVPQKYPGKRAYRGPNKGTFSGNPLGKNPGDVWVFPNVKSNHVEKTIHPCQFPIELPMRLILALTKKGDLVVDPFMGVGSSGVAASMIGRRFAGADVVKDYVDMARLRILAAIRGTLNFREPLTPIHIPKPGSKLTTVPAHFRQPVILP